MKQSTYKLKVPDDVARIIKIMHPLLRNKIKAAFQRILADPFEGKPLKHELEGLRGYRVSKLRIIYRISSASVIEIVAIGPRANIYHDWTKYSEIHDPATQGIKSQSTDSIHTTQSLNTYYAVENELAESLTKIAKKHNLSPTALLNSWIKEKIK